MGASVVAWWPGISGAQLEGQPGFANDCKAWGDWMAVREDHPEVVDAVNRLGVSALLTSTTEGVAAEDVHWVAPKDLARAARRLRELVLARHADTRAIVYTYAINANAVDPVEDELAQDLADVAEIAEWARREGATRMTFRVNW